MVLLMAFQHWHTDGAATTLPVWKPHGGGSRSSKWAQAAFAACSSAGPTAGAIDGVQSSRLCHGASAVYGGCRVAASLGFC
jgi:hypothetical protein